MVNYWLLSLLTFDGSTILVNNLLMRTRWSARVVIRCKPPVGVLEATVQEQVRRGSVPYEMDLIVAVKHRNLRAVEALCREGGDVNATDADGWTPLHWAVRRGGEVSVNIAKVLLAHGAHVDAKTKAGMTPLRWAEVFGKTDLIKLLRAASEAQRCGFTLVELAMVLVIVGLLVGGILVGRDLIRVAEMRKVHRQYEQFVAAANAFRSKYNCLPGDCDHLESIFGRDPNDCPPPAAAAQSTAACDGDGDGFLNGNEPLEAWRNLGAAGLIDGTYSAAPTADPGVLSFWWVLTAGYNCPKLISDSFCWGWVDDAEPGPVDFSVGSGRYGNTVLVMIRTQLGSRFQSASNFSLVSEAYALGLTLATTDWVYTPQEALLYDSKFDDGNPISGNVMGEILDDVIGPKCVIEVSGDVYRYDVSHTRQTCGFFYRTGF